MATTLQKEKVYDGTRSSAIDIIMGRTFGNIIVQVALVLLCLMWTIPTAGLFLSSFRTPDAIRTTGWWTIFAGRSTNTYDTDIEVLPSGEETADTNAIAAGSTLSVTAEDSPLVDFVVEGFPEAAISEFRVNTVEGELTAEEFGEPLVIEGIGELVLNEDGTHEFTAAEGFSGFFIPDIDAEDVEAVPFTFEYEMSGRRTVEGELEIPAVGEETVVPQIGSIVVNNDGEFTFEPRSNFFGEFDAEVGDVPTEGAFTISYNAVRSGGTLVNADAGESIDVPLAGALTVNPDGSYEFNADETYMGEFEVAYDLRDSLVTFDNYDFVLFSDGMGQAFLNSLTVTIPATIIPISIAAFAAYAFSWMEFPGRRILFIIVVGLMVVPLQLSLIPLLRVYTTLGINGTFLGLWLAHTGFGMPLAVFLLRNYIGNLPRELIESAFIDGASHFTIFVRLILPLSVPALASFAIFQFLWVWNDLLIALVFLGRTPVVTSRLSEMVGSRGQDWHVLTAGAFITMTIPLIVFFSLQRYFVRGLLAGSVKGG